MERTWRNLTAAQFGVLARAQAVALGLTRHQIQTLLTNGTWARVHPEVFRATAAPDSWRQRLVAATLWAKGRAVVYGRAAAALWELQGYGRGRVELASTSDLTAPEGILLHRVMRLERADRTVRYGIPVTTVERTILDLGRFVTPLRLERTLDEALRRKMVSVEHVKWCIERNGRRGRGQVAHLESLLAERTHQKSTDSELETDVAAFLREAKLPTPIRRHCIIEKDHYLIEGDLVWPEAKVVVLVHGGTIHRQPRTWEEDQWIENVLQEHGWRVIKITREMLRTRRGALEALVHRALAARHSQAVLGDAPRQ